MVSFKKSFFPSNKHRVKKWADSGKQRKVITTQLFKKIPRTLGPLKRSVVLCKTTDRSTWKIRPPGSFWFLDQSYSKNFLWLWECSTSVICISHHLAGYWKTKFIWSFSGFHEAWPAKLLLWWAVQDQTFLFSLPSWTLCKCSHWTSCLNLSVISALNG